ITLAEGDRAVAAGLRDGQIVVVVDGGDAAQVDVVDAGLIRINAVVAATLVLPRVPDRVDEDVAAGAAEHLVVAEPAVEEIVAAVAGEEVVEGGAGNAIDAAGDGGAGAAADCAIAEVDVDAAVCMVEGDAGIAVAGDGVAAAQPLELVQRAVRIERYVRAALVGAVLVEPCGNEDIVAVGAADTLDFEEIAGGIGDIGAGGEIDCHRRAAAIENHHVEAAQAVGCIGAATAVEILGRGAVAAGELVGELRADNGIDAAGDGGIADIGSGRGAALQVDGNAVGLADGEVGQRGVAAAGDGVVAFPGRKGIDEARFVVERVVLRAGHRAAGAEIEGHGGGGIRIVGSVDAVSADQRIARARAKPWIENIVAVVADKDIGLAVADELIAAAAADQTLEIEGLIATLAAGGIDERRAAIVEHDIDGIDGMLVAQDIEAAETVHDVVAGAAFDDVIAGIAGEDVAGRAAADVLETVAGVARGIAARYRAAVA